ncbi:hypothetical protein SAMN05443633_109179 [Chryseobacterium arachidis]|uniref:Acetyltransferase (GNAT) domain-containing protein n=1 Tax=Chryseobacterium arachidis TaxID=1416778 RepID=A0A1M5GM02_9FLAO|nr:hypothetical protein [Chryseobacterium arachidis]SHG04754.1 hypothetical protein SAMN05443633_109179 [Chryseobacterium arachidis]
MIRRLKYHEIDFEKYRLCLENSEQRKYSATRIFLDVTARKNWEILVFNDYEAVMPIPFIRKLGVKLVVNPKLCQQLGVFSEKDDIELNDSFLDFFEKKYNVWYYAFNDTNTFSKPLKKRNNFLILPQAYEIVRQKYSPKRKRKLRLDEDVLMTSEVKNITMEEAYPFISKNLIGAKHEGDKQVYLDIFNDFSNSGKLKITAFVYKNEIINAIAVYYDEKSLALLGTFNEKDFVKLSGSSVIIDRVIKENIEDRIFDFEGSEIPSIEEFFRGFRPELRPYSVVWNSKKEIAAGLLNIRKYL